MHLISVPGIVGLTSRSEKPEAGFAITPPRDHSAERGMSDAQQRTAQQYRETAVEIRLAAQRTRYRTAAA